MMGSAHASKADRARIEQLVAPQNQRKVPLGQALAAIAAAAALPLHIDVCASLVNEPVTIVTRTPEKLGVLVTGAAMQVGARLRLYIGQHGEVARPTLYCPENQGALVTIGGAER